MTSREQERERYHRRKQDEGWKERQREYRRTRWHSEPEHREGAQARIRRRRQTPEGWAAQRSSALHGATTPAEILGLLKLQGYRCAVTGWPLDLALARPHPLQPSIDHVTPKAEGGADTIDNLRVVIWAVNAARGGSSKHDAIIDAIFRRHGEQIPLFPS